MKYNVLVLILLLSNVLLFSQNQDMPSVRMGLNAGPSYQLQNINSNLQPLVYEYAKDLNSGFHFSGDLLYFPKEKIGLGFTTSLFISNGKLSDYYKDVLGEFITRSDQTKIWFVGALLSTRLMTEDYKSTLYFNGGLGAIRYISKISGGQYSKTFSNISPGVYAELAYDFKLSKYLELGFSCSFLVGYTEYIQIESFETMSEIKEKQSISRIDFSVGLRLVK